MNEMMKVPDGWEVFKLSDIGEIITGNTPSTNNQEYYDGNIPFIGPSDLDDKKYIVNSNKTLTNEGFEQTRKLPKNSILVTCIGELGKIGISKIELATNQQINSIICNKKFDTEFVYYALIIDVKSQMQKEAGLQVVPIVNKSSFSKLKLIVPKEKKEQKKIAKILSTLDKAIESTNRLIEKEKNIKTALMQELLTNGIDQNGQIRSPKTHTYKQSELGLIPDEWEVKKVGKISKTFAGGTPDRENSSYYNGNIPWVKSGEVNKSVITRTEETITQDGLSNSSAKFVQKGTILVAMYGATAGKVALLNIEATTNQAILAVPLKNDDTFFILNMLEQHMSKLVFQAQGSGQPNLSKQMVDGMLLPISPLEEQKQIAKILTTQDKKIQTEETNLAKLKELKKGLMNDLLSGKVRVKI